MIAEPPSAGAVQVITTLLLEIAVVGAYGVKGTVAGIIAPLPTGDTADSPIAFVAIILAETLDPTTRLQGEAFKTEMAIVQDVAIPVQSESFIMNVRSLC